MTQKQVGFKKGDKHYITSNQLQVDCIILLCIIFTFCIKDLLSIIPLFMQAQAYGKTSKRKSNATEAHKQATNDCSKTRAAKKTKEN